MRMKELAIRKSLAAAENIAIFRALQLGDLMCAVPAFRAIRKAFPASRIILIGLPWAKSFAARFAKYFDGYMEFPGYPGLPEQDYDAARFAAFSEEIKKRKLDLLLQMHGSGKITNPLMAHFDARFVSGYFPAGLPFLGGPLFLPHRENEHEVLRYIRLARFIGAGYAGTELEFPVFPEEEQAYRRVKKAFGLEGKPYVCLHPGARDPRRRWPAANFARVGDMLASDGYKVLVTGAADEKEIADEVLAKMSKPAASAAGAAGLGELAMLLKSSKLLVTNDTGVSHLAAAMKAPSVIIFTKYSDPARWAPLDKSLHKAVSGKSSAPASVFQAARALLKQAGARQPLGV